MSQVSYAPQNYLGWTHFVRENLLPREPSVWHWNAIASSAMPWSLDSFKDRFPQREIILDDMEEERVVLREYLEEIQSALNAGKTVSSVRYLKNVWLKHSFSELVEEICLPPFLKENLLTHPLLSNVVPEVWSPWIELFISAPGTRYPAVHVDRWMTHAWLMQVFGEKCFYLWPPRHRGLNDLQHTYKDDDTRAMRLRNAQLSIGIDDETPLGSLFEHAMPIALHVNANQAVFVPAGWWHTAQSVTSSITLSGNFVSSDNFEDFLAAMRMNCDENEATLRNDNDSSAYLKECTDMIHQFEKLRPLAHTKLEHLIELLG
jgi:histone arginine demethylase JMJD6